MGYMPASHNLCEYTDGMHHFMFVRYHRKFITWHVSTRQLILHAKEIIKPGVWFITKAVHVYIPQKFHTEIVISQKM